MKTIFILISIFGFQNEIKIGISKYEYSNNITNMIIITYS